MKHAHLFSTPMLSTAVSGTATLNAALTALLLEEAATVPSRLHSNVGGWHSAQDLMRRDAPPFQALTGLMTHHLQQGIQQVAGNLPERMEISGQAWAMVMEDGHHGMPHHHGEAHFSCVYYVDAGDPPPADDPEAGSLVFMDPRGAISAGPLLLYPPVHSLTPEAGMFIMFPGYLVHFVRSHRGPRPRISVAANFVLQ